jgi:ubiquinol-cytochrome c reductase cytochrome b/c1 subunit
MRALTVAVATLALSFATPSIAAEPGETPPRQSWSFSGPFGTYDRAQLQRGFKVYREVCATCHSIGLLAFRNLAQPGGPGFTRAQAEVIASEYQVPDGPNDQGEMFERPGQLHDRFPAPFENEQQARSIHGGAYPPDLTVIAKARGYEVGVVGGAIDLVTQYQEYGVDYLHALLTGYGEPPAGVKVEPPQNWNRYYPGNRIAMAPPLKDGQVEYGDGSPQTVAQYSRDVSAFLMWAAEPHLESRKRIGFQVILFLLVFAGLMYFTKKKVWSQAHA